MASFRRCHGGNVGIGCACQEHHQMLHGVVAVKCADDAGKRRHMFTASMLRQAWVRRAHATPVEERSQVTMYANGSCCSASRI